MLPWIAGFASICLAMPILATQFGFGVRRSEVASWLSSFLERIDFMWPDALAIWFTHGNLFTGRGLGGIGFAQGAAEWWRYNAADNLMIYLLVSFGLFAIVYAGGFLLSLRRTFAADPSLEFLARCVRGWALVVFSYGCTSNMVEQPLMNMVIRAVSAPSPWCSRRRRRCAHESLPVNRCAGVRGSRRGRDAGREECAHAAGDLDQGVLSSRARSRSGSVFISGRTGMPSMRPPRRWSRDASLRFAMIASWHRLERQKVCSSFPTVCGISISS